MAMKNVFLFYLFYQLRVFQLAFEKLVSFVLVNTMYSIYATYHLHLGLHERYYIANHLSGCLMLAVSGYWPKVITGSLHRLYLLPSFRKFPKKNYDVRRRYQFFFFEKMKTPDCRSLDFLRT